MIRNFSAEKKERRQKRVAELIREEIVSILRREVKDPRVKDLTVTEIDLKPDLRSVTVYVCKFAAGDGHEPTPAEQESLMAGLKSAGHYIYESLKRRLVMKVIPSVRFEYDDRLAIGSKVWGIMNQMEAKS